MGGVVERRGAHVDETGAVDLRGWRGVFLAERVLPEFDAVEPPSSEAFARWHMRRSLHAMGAATETDLHKYLTYGASPRASQCLVLGAKARAPSAFRRR